MAVLETSCPKYQRRRPELTPCYRIINQHLDSFVAERAREGRPLPEYALEEFEAYLKCGVARHSIRASAAIPACLSPVEVATLRLLRRFRSDRNVAKIEGRRLQWGI